MPSVSEQLPISGPHAPHVRAIVSRDLSLIYAGGIGASQTNATDALAQLDALLQVANSSLTLTMGWDKNPFFIFSAWKVSIFVHHWEVGKNPESSDWSNFTL